MQDAMKLRALEAPTENGASNWLTVLPLHQQGFFLKKQALWDALRMRYVIPLKRIPQNCCVAPLSMSSMHYHVLKEVSLSFTIMKFDC